MHFLVTAWDGTDTKALDRRMAAREAHLAKARQLHAEGKLLTAGAMLDATGRMIGSTLILAVADQAEAEALVLADAYVAGKVWERWEICPFKVAPLGQPS